MDFWFSLKKLLSITVNPVSLTLELIFLGLVLVSFASRQLRKPAGPKWARFRAFLGDFGVFFIALGMLTLFLCSIDPVAHRLTLHLEGQNSPLEEKGGVPLVPAPPHFIVILADRHPSAPGKPTLSRLSASGLARVVGAVDLGKFFPEARYIVTGQSDETTAMRAVAERLGVSPEKILEEIEWEDSGYQPRFLKAILGDAPFLLVTSAVAMPRAVSQFRGQGYQPIVAPVDFMLSPTAGEGDSYRPEMLLPRVSNLQLSTIALHEIGIMAWSKWRGEAEGSPAP